MALPDGSRDDAPRASPSSHGEFAAEPGVDPRLFEAVVHQSTVAIIITDLENRILAWSRGASELLGYGRAEVVGADSRFLIPVERSEEEERGLWSEVRSGASVLYFATERSSKAGRRIPVEVCCTPVRDGRGDPAAYCSVILDQSDKKEMQERILQAERLTALARVVGKVFHELRTPLGVLVLQADILAEEIEDVVASAGDRVDAAHARRLRDSLEVFTREIQRIEGLAEDYLLMIRPIRAHLTPVRLGDFLETVRRELCAKSRRAGYEVRVDCGDPDLMVSLDPLQMLRVFHNLAGNSLDAIEESRTPILVLDAARRGDRLILQLRDNGPGLPPALAGGGAFEIFSTTKHRGSGLGLHLVSEIVAAHGGRIELANHAGGGAEAVISLPLGGAREDA